MKAIKFIFLISLLSLNSCIYFKEYTVKYEVTGTSEDVTIHYRVPWENMVEENVSLPWEKTFTVSLEVYEEGEEFETKIAVCNNGDESGSIDVYIHVDGVEKKFDHSKGVSGFAFAQKNLK